MVPAIYLLNVLNDTSARIGLMSTTHSQALHQHIRFYILL